MAVSTLSKSKRFNEIFHILLTHDFASMLRDLATYGRHAKKPQPVLDNGASADTLPARVRRLMEDLGPTFIKIGQLLGTRPDLIPAPFIEEFKKFYDQTPPTPFPKIREVVDRDLTRPFDAVFRSFDETPSRRRPSGRCIARSLRPASRWP